MVVTCPLEVIKTRLQSSTHSDIQVYHKFGMRTWYAGRDILEKEGIRGLWRGVGPNFVGVAPSRAIYFGTYSTTSSFLSKSLGVEDSTPIYLFSAIVAGVSVATITAPIWLVKTRMQLQRSGSNIDVSKNYLNSFDCVRRVYHEEGIRAFYKGLVASYIGVSESTIQFVLYEKFKSLLRRYKKKKLEDDILAKHIILNPLEILGTASAAKLIASAATYPHEVVRTRLREQRSTGKELKYKGFLHTLKLIASEEGIVGLYGGMGAHLIRVVPNAAIMFLTYEMVVKALS